MPCYLFTWHAYGTWMPDRPQGYVKSQQVLASDPEAARRYRQRQTDPAARFDDSTQSVIIDELRLASGHRRVRLHGVATDPSHLHILLSWVDDRTFEVVRRGVRESITRRLNQQQRRRWLAHRGSRKRIVDRKHFDYLIGHYLPSHRGVCWFESNPPE